MKVVINLAKKESSIKQLAVFKDNEYVPFYVKINNSYIKDLNKILGANIFTKNTVYINSQTLWEIMQPVGSKGSHHYHGLEPEEIYRALSRLRYSKNVTTSYDNRVVAVTDVIVNNNLNLLVVIDPHAYIVKHGLRNIISLITIYPVNNEK